QDAGGCSHDGGCGDERVSARGVERCAFRVWRLGRSVVSIRLSDADMPSHHCANPPPVIFRWLTLVDPVAVARVGQKLRAPTTVAIR
ncbi:MAG: hypothetical protein MN733_06280, partial [Nitrososphaera sp.]|nr:hypothetical protein [Nitrososphaera sp.]